MKNPGYMKQDQSRQNNYTQHFSCSEFLRTVMTSASPTTSHSCRVVDKTLLRFRSYKSSLRPMEIW